MKNFLFILFFIPLISFSQNKIAKTADGKIVILRKDHTWQYIDSTNNKIQKDNNQCKVPKNFKEPKWNKSRSFKHLGITVDDLKENIAATYDLKLKDIILIRISEHIGNAIYVFCIKGKIVKYKRIGSVFSKEGDLFFEK